MKRCAVLALVALLGWVLLPAATGYPTGQEGDFEAGGANLRKATFAGGCFWCMEPPFDKLEGVLDTTVGYTGGHTRDPTYEEVSSGTTGHAEVVRITYDPGRISYEKLLHVFWRQIDPTAENRQFCDVGSQYRSGIFYHNPRQKRLAEASKRELAKNGPFEEPIVTEIQPASAFYRAEDYHQNYYKTHPLRYKFYRWNCGRDQFLARVWGEEKPEPPGQ